MQEKRSDLRDPVYPSSLIQRKIDRKLRALSWDAAHGDISMMQLNDALHNGQA